MLLAKSKENTLLYIPDKFQRVKMTKYFRRSVCHRSLKEMCDLFEIVSKEVL